MSASISFYKLKQRIRNKLRALSGHEKRLPTSVDFEATPAQWSAYQPADRLSKIFAEHKGRPADKWLQYLPVYDRYVGEALAKFGPKIRLLEIGVSKGGSLELWRKFLGPDATIVGLDIDPECANRFDPPNKVFIGSQDDSTFLRSVVAEMGGADVIIDDGSHIGRHQNTSFRTLFPELSEGGTYIIEDLHTSYWPGLHEGGLNRPDSGIEMLKRIIDDMHAHYHLEGRFAGTDIDSMLVTDSIAAIGKKRFQNPMRHVAGG